MKKFGDLLPPLHEGVYDQHIFKAFFLAGGPGSGKSYVVSRTTGGSGLKLVNSDDAFENLLRKAGLSLKMPSSEEEPRDVVRGRAKEITAKKKANYLEGRLGLIIDGTGREAEKILFQKRQLEELGYDTYMIFVNTSLDVALERNAKRERSVRDSVATNSWRAVQSNIGKFSQHFRQNFIVVDNNDADIKDPQILNDVLRQIRRLLRKKVTNPAAKQWVMQQMKERGITIAPKGF